MDLALNNLQRLICHRTHQTKPLQNFLSHFVIVTNWTFTFSTTNVFDCSHAIMAHLRVIRCKFLNYSKLHVHLGSLGFTYQVRHCTMCWHGNYHNTTNCSRYLSWFELLWSHDIYVLQTYTIYFFINLFLLIFIHSFFIIVIGIKYLPWKYITYLSLKFLLNLTKFYLLFSLYLIF